MSKVTVSLVTFMNSEIQLKRVLDSVFKSSNLIIKFIVVDNSPSDGLRKIFNNPLVEYIFNSANIGFGAAHNIAIQRATELGSQYHLIINPDIYFKGCVLEKMLEFMDDDLSIGLMMPQILYPDGKVQYLPKLLPTPLQLLIRKLPFPQKMFAEMNKFYELRDIEYNRVYEIAIVSGCFSLYRTAVFKEVGFYDEKYFMYFEDFDISRRVHLKFKTIFFPSVSVYHDYGRGAQKSFRLFKTFLYSAFVYFNKWGWFFDKERTRINKYILNSYKR